MHKLPTHAFGARGESAREGCGRTNGWVGQIRHTRHRRSCERADVTAIELNIMQLPSRARTVKISAILIKAIAAHPPPTVSVAAAAANDEYNVMGLDRTRLIDTLILSAAHKR